MKIASWNVNGIRAATKNGFLDWFGEVKPDVVCLQETKAHPDQLEEKVLHPKKYHSYWHSAQKKGYSGVAIYSKKEPLSIQEGIEVDEIDAEGRVILAEYPDFTLINAYFPNSQRDHARLDYKLRFCEKMEKFLKKLHRKGTNIVLCGDYNIAHKEIDLKNPKSNQKNAGFLPEERAWMDRFLKKTFVDLFRHQTNEPDHYTWWSYRPGVRERNIGWRLDYFCSNEEFLDKVKKVDHQTQVRGSDHCPILLNLKK